MRAENQVAHQPDPRSGESGYDSLPHEPLEEPSVGWLKWGIVAPNAGFGFDFMDSPFGDPVAGPWPRKKSLQSQDLENQMCAP